MKTILILLIVSLMTAACSKVDTAHKAEEPQKTGKEQYFCPMHPQVKSDKPGVCPICQMDLVLPGNEHEMESGTDSTIGMLLTLDARRQVLADVRTVPVSKERISHVLTVTGTLVPSESAQRTITARVNGRVERLFVRQTGERVREGQALYEVYSPALVQAQSDFMLTLKSVAQAVVQDAQPDGVPSPHTAKAESMRTFSAKARERLLLLGMTSAQIDAVAKSGEAQTRIVIHSPFSGTVTQKNIVEGASIQEGASLFDLADFSTVWNIAEVYEHDVSTVRIGQRVTMRFAAYPGEVFQGRVSFLYPTLNTETRTVKVRIESANPHGKLRPGMFSETELTRDIAAALTVPEESVILSGRQAIVWVKEGEDDGSGKGKFRAQAVTLGVRSGGKYEVLSGLREGETVAASGGFLLDSERQLRGGAVTEASSAKTPAPEHTNHEHQSSLSPVQLPPNLASQMNGVIDAYSALTEALVQSNKQDAAKSASTLAQAVERVNASSLSKDAVGAWKDVRGHLLNDAQSLQSASELEAQRKVFERLSNTLFMALKTFRGAKTLHRAYCPMAFDDKGAYWLTPTKTIRNPYFGEEMLHCGEIRE